MTEDLSERCTVTQANLDHAPDAEGVLSMIRAYARDPFGQGRDLDPPVRESLIDRLREQPGALIFLARMGHRPVGIAVCFRGFSTFAARPLVNIHDVYVDPAARGQGVGIRLLEAVEAKARALDCCKLTLEVQERNTTARGLYERFGFVEGVYDADAGRILFRWKAV